ncbi:MAG: RecX family transcriptional regulator [Thermodesulfobacteriota bacterium]|nr:RecX family transcriptional regulator [Thermodesulfobacteriota bacterium]
MKKEQITKAYSLCIRFLAPRARSVKEINDYLAKKGFNKDVRNETIDLLLNKNLLNDKEFAYLFVESREKFRPRSKFALEYELRQKGIQEAIIEEVLMDIDEQKSAWIAVASRIETWNIHGPDKFKKKIMNYLKNRGFSYEISISTYSQCCSSLQCKEL